MRIHTLSTSWANLLVVLLLELPSLQEESNQCRAGGSEPLWPFEGRVGASEWDKKEQKQPKKSKKPLTKEAPRLRLKGLTFFWRGALPLLTHNLALKKQTTCDLTILTVFFNNNLQMFQANADTILFWVRLWTNSRLGVQKVVVNAPVRLQVQHRDFSDGNLCGVWPCDLPCVWWPPAIW